MYKNKFSDEKLRLYDELIHQYELELKQEIEWGQTANVEFIEEKIKELKGLKIYLENWTMGD